MPLKTVDIRIRRNSTHTQIINSLSSLFNASESDKFDVYIEIDSPFVYSDHLLLVSTAINSTIARGIKIEGKVFCSRECHDYVSRMNFYESLGMKLEESFVRQDSGGRFLEISEFKDDTKSNSLINRVINILREQKITDESILATLSFCLGELVGNVIEHSSPEQKLPLANGGWIVAQYYAKKRIIRIMVADNGQGIHKALTTTPKNQKYKTYTPKESLENCTVKGVTNGNGLGNGLFATSNFIKLNGGELMIHSGNWALRYTKNSKIVYPTHYWQGTLVFLEINSNVPVETKNVLDGYTDFVDDYKDWFPVAEQVATTNILW